PEVLHDLGTLDSRDGTAGPGHPTSDEGRGPPIDELFRGERHHPILSASIGKRGVGRPDVRPDQPWPFLRAATTAAARARPSATRRSTPLLSCSWRTRSKVSWSSA